MAALLQVTLIYHKPLNAAWEEAAKGLRTYLAQVIQSIEAQAAGVVCQVAATSIVAVSMSLCRAEAGTGRLENAHWWRCA